jgi:phage shock protein A
VGGNMDIKSIRSVDELIEKMGLTSEELEKHRELIKECLKREESIRKSGKETRHNLQRLSEAVSFVVKKMDETSQILGEFELKLIPEKEFHRV